MKKIALTGGDGLVGSRIIELLKNDFTFRNIAQSQMDITDKQKVNSVINSTDFDIFLHLAAYTNVQGARLNQELAYRINRDGTKNILDAVTSRNKKMIYVSTDFVFDGTAPFYLENSLPNPQGIYAKSKFEGEQIVSKKAMIVRISYPYRSNFPVKNDFFRTFKLLLEQKKPFSAIVDSSMTPTFIDDIAYGLKYLFDNYSPEIFHLVGSSSHSPYDAALMIANKFKLDHSSLTKTTHEKYCIGKEPIPKSAVIKSSKNSFCKMKSFEEGLTEIAKQISNI